MELIVAMTEEGVIGNDGSIPWHIPEDLKHFKEITTGSVVIMGRKTFESLPGRKPLKDRINIVMTKKTSFPDVITIDIISLQEVLQKYVGKKVFVIGGGEIYSALFHLCEKLHITVVYKTIDSLSTIKFPYNLNAIYQSFKLINEGERLNSKNGQQYRFLTFTKIS